MVTAKVAEDAQSAPGALGSLESESGSGPIRADARWNPGHIKYSVCTLVTCVEQYDEMRRSFVERGFDTRDIEFLYIDNSIRNEFDGYSGCNLFLSVARGEYIIICHQDVLLEGHGRPELDDRLSELEILDPNWAVCGNSGGISLKRLAIRISDPHGENMRHGKLPARVSGVDENFVVVKRRSNLSLSRDLSGFHLYGADLCVIAGILGYTSYVIDFHLRHRSGGRGDASFSAARTALVRKYARSFRSRWIRTACAMVFLSGTPLVGAALSHPFFTRILHRVLVTLDPWDGES